MRIADNDQRSTAWADDERFWFVMQPAMCAPARLSIAEADVDSISDWLHLEAPLRVLDLACGPGAHAVVFAARGHRVSALDRFDACLDHGRATAAQKGCDLEWIKGDMRTFRRDDAFDVVCNLYNSFAYFDDLTNRRILENIYASLRTGGHVLLDLISQETVARFWVDQQELKIGDSHYVERRSITNDYATLVSDWTIMQEETEHHYQVRQRLYSGMELREILRKIGFVQIELSGSLDGLSAFDQSARRLVIHAVKA